MTSPTFDVSGAFQHLAFTNVTTCAVVGVSTTSSTGVLCAFISYEGGSGAPASISSVSGGGLTWTKRKRVLNTNGSTNSVALELWTAPYASAVSSQTITATASGTCDGINMVCFGVTGVNSTAAPFDSNAGLPDSTITASASSPPTVTYSTSSPDDLVFFFAASSGSGPGHCSNPPTGYTSPANGIGSGGGVNWCDFGVFYKSVSALQSSVSVTLGGTANDGYVAMVDAFTADSLGESGTTVLAFGPIKLNVSGTREETGTAILSFGPIKLNVSGTREETGTAILSFGGVKYVVSGNREEDATAALAFGGVKFSIHGGHGPAGSVVMAFGGVNITALGLDAPPAGHGKRQFWTFGA